MSTTAKLFVKDGVSVFPSKDGQTTSMCVEILNSSLDLTTGFIRDEKMLFWVKGTSEETVANNTNTLIANINKGILRGYRAFSNAPFYEGQSSDINPQTQQVLNRYSQVRLCPSAKFDELHRQYVVNETVASTEDVTP